MVFLQRWGHGKLVPLQNWIVHSQFLDWSWKPYILVDWHAHLWKEKKRKYDSLGKKKSTEFHSITMERQIHVNISYMQSWEGLLPVRIYTIQNGLELGVYLAFLHHREIITQGSETRLEFLMVKFTTLVLVKMSAGERQKIQIKNKIQDFLWLTYYFCHHRKCNT